jgi:hypothetical protein
MKRVLIALALVAQAAATAGVAGAQTDQPSYLKLPHNFHIFLEGGGALPYRPGEWNELWNSSFAFTLGGGASIFPWLEVNGGFSHMAFANNSIKTKSELRYQGIKEVQGGSVSTNVFYASARFIAVPSTRTNPFVEMAVCYYSTSAENLVVEGEIDNSMPDVSGMTIAPMIGIQYALADYWVAYAKYTYMLNLSDEFAPGDLLQPAGGGRAVEPGNQVIETISVGIQLQF